MHSREMQHKTFLLMLVAVTAAFGWIIWPFYGAVFWGVVLAILFSPLYQRLLGRLGQRRNLASILTLTLCLLVVILPTTLISVSLLQEAATVFERVRANQIDFAAYFRQVIDALPAWLVKVLDRFGFAQLATLQEKLAASAAQGSQLVARQAVNVGQNMLDFVISFGVMLYLLFFLLRDGAMLAARVKQAIPLSAAHKQQLFSRFVTVIRATVKGNIVVAVVQGALGGAMFWFLDVQAALLWGALMAFLSLLPAVGAGLVWGPVAVYFLLTGAIWQGVTLILFGVFVIGLVDNVLRPVLVGKDTRMPDYMVLISTIGGMALFGLNGFVIGPVIAALFIACWDMFAVEAELRHSGDGS
ncbi:AI-2E family transporter [Noviherbaspirillum sp. UKPF54]|uniref:AI-2E family transporter n=1 Tax=Noviherbaspirillum sp. UKPF54 TaxID=2601898 RepID=UPI0011B13554|nr:AI-2E family transporter [Noviherbaspirillum sp. UKPF54]QDZ29901.1 AI-2E family transporter [Noviherbaspirillum sp. UKPF54]